MGLTIEVFHHSEATKILKNNDLEFSFDNCVRKKVTIYSPEFIHAVMPITEGEKEYTEVYTECGVLSCPYTHDELTAMIDEYFECDLEEILSSES